MSYIDDTTSDPASLIWIGAAIVVGGVSAGLAYLLTHSITLAASFTGVILVSLALGWWASHSANSGMFRQNTEISEPVPRGPSNSNVILDLQPATLFARSAIEATPNPVMIIDQSGRIITINQAAKARFSVGDNSVRFNSVVRRPDLIDAVETVLVDGISRSLSIETRVPVDRFERVSVAAFKAAAVQYVLVSIFDETEARMSERMRADFLANASHELRTPLAAIIGFIETLRGPARNDTKAREQFLEVMHAQAGRMSRLISDLLSLSRIELNEHVPPTGLSDIASTAYEAADGLTPDKKKRLILNVARHAIWVLGDRDEMAQVMLNLIDNALKYSRPDSHITVSVTDDLSREDAVALAMRQWESAARLPLTSPELERHRRYAVIRVENIGEGIDRQHLPRLSERFFRIEDTASGKSGTGLGLAIVKHIISRHRGGLVVESELSKGTAFSIYLPQPFEKIDSTEIRLPTITDNQPTASVT